MASNLLVNLAIIGVVILFAVFLLIKILLANLPVLRGAILLA